MEEQLTIPMPVTAVDVTMRRDPGRGYVVTLRTCRQDQGWQTRGVWRESSQQGAEMRAADALGSGWWLDPLD